MTKLTVVTFSFQRGRLFVYWLIRSFVFIVSYICLLVWSSFVYSLYLLIWSSFEARLKLIWMFKLPYLMDCTFVRLYSEWLLQCFSEVECWILYSRRNRQNWNPLRATLYALLEVKQKTAVTLLFIPKQDWTSKESMLIS